MRALPQKLALSDALFLPTRSEQMHRALRQSPLVSHCRVLLRFFDRVPTEDRHDLMRGSTVVGIPSAVIVSRLLARSRGNDGFRVRTRLTANAGVRLACGPASPSRLQQPAATVRYTEEPERFGLITAFAKGDVTRGSEMARGRRGVRSGARRKVKCTSRLPRAPQVTQETRAALSGRVYRPSCIEGTSVIGNRLPK
jgi:hypothetical protein